LTEELWLSKNRARHSAEQILKKRQDADAMFAAGKSLGENFQGLAISGIALNTAANLRGCSSCCFIQ
jgi:hypothetical protein